MKKIFGQEFFPSQQKCDTVHPNGKMFIKIGFASFSGFETHAEFFRWFMGYYKICQKNKKSFEIYECVRGRLANAFYADIEAYSPTHLDPSQVQEIQDKIIRHVESAVSRLCPHVKNGGSWTGDHRPDNKKPGMKFKISMHVVFNDLLASDITRNGPMVDLAHAINKSVMTELREQGGPLINSLTIPHDEILDMAVYRENGCMRAVYGSKGSDYKCFFNPIGEFTRLQDYFITKDIPIVDIPPEQLIAVETKISGVKPVKSIPRKNKKVDPKDQTEMERTITKQIREWGDGTSIVLSQGVDYYGNPKFYVRGVGRVCPCCPGRIHNSNGAKVTHLGSGNFVYRCMSSSNKGNVTKPFYIPHQEKQDEEPICEPITSEPEPPRKKMKQTQLSEYTEEGIEKKNHKLAIDMKKKQKKYLGTFVGTKQRCLIVKSPMGSGKTYRTKEFIDQLEGNPSVLWVTPRKAMAIFLKGLFPKFALYTETMNAHHQIVEYESLNKVSRTYDIIILDEIRSLIKSFVSVTTNRENLVDHMEFLVDLCRCSRHTLMLDADVRVDGAVHTFVDYVFGSEEPRAINHDMGHMDLEHIWVHENNFLCRMYSDLRDGKRVMLCCGSSSILKGIGEEVSKIVGNEKVGIYHADSPKQHELDDVKTHWEKYDFIGFTSTITCSLSYEGIIYRVYVLPCRRTACPREMAQMFARARNIMSGQVIIQDFGQGPIGPLNPDHETLYAEKLEELMTKRVLAVRSKSDHERMYVSTVKRKPSCKGIIYSPTILTKLAAWDLVEEYIKQNFWCQEYMRVLQGKKISWRWDEYIFPTTESDGETEMDHVDKARKKLKEEEIRKLGMIDVRGMCQKDIGDLLKKIIKQTATEDDILSYRKHQSQRFFTDNLTGEEVASFELNKRPIVNLILRTKLDTIFRDKLYMNYVDMGLDPEFGKTDLHVIKLLHDCLGEYSINCIFDDTSMLDFSIDNPSVQDILKQIDSLSSCRCRAKSLKRRLSHYLERYLGVSVKKFMVWNPILKKSVPTFKLSICFSDWLEKKTIIGTNKWIRQKFEEYDRFKKIPLGSEYKFNRARRTIVGFCNKYYDLKNKEPIVNPFAKFAYSPII